MFVVLRCLQDYEDVFKNPVAEFETEAQAEAYVDAHCCDSDWGLWYEVNEQ